MAQVYLVRHCESEGNATRRTQAHVDALVTSKGYEQNEMLRRRFEGIHIDALYSSDSYRSIMTIDPIAKERNLPIHVRISLREITTGIWEDSAWGNIADEYPEANKAWTETPWDLKTPGASNFKMLADMCIFGLKRIAREIGPDGVAIAVSHSCTIKATLCTLLGKPLTEVKQFGHGDNTSVSLLEIDEAGNIRVVFMNDDSHLPPRLKRAWGGVAGADINMAVYPVDSEKRMEELLTLAAQSAAERGEAFDAGAYREKAKAALEKDPACIAISYLKGSVSGYVHYGTGENLPADCRLIDRMYVIPALQGKGYCEQLFGYAAHEMRYKDMQTVAVPRNCTPEEQRVVDHFMFAPMAGHPNYWVLGLYNPPCPYPILA